mmetsp:Transcript_85883/g.277338  ORF Transcript_85883/g.277338 Transcript_85883/m.277338 type:complete len:202 (+) Transcript_85883:438-1043(+)
MHWAFCRRGSPQEIVKPPCRQKPWVPWAGSSRTKTGDLPCSRAASTSAARASRKSAQFACSSKSSTALISRRHKSARTSWPKDSAASTSARAPEIVATRPWGATTIKSGAASPAGKGTATVVVTPQTSATHVTTTITTTMATLWLQQRSWLGWCRHLGRIPRSCRTSTRSSVIPRIQARQTHTSPVSGASIGSTCTLGVAG